MNSLKEYVEKRDVQEVPAKPGKKAYGRRRLFVLDRHDAERVGLHADFRYHDGAVLKSWCLPKLWPDHEGVTRLAIQTEDHPLGWLKFEGEIKGRYGRGTVKIDEFGVVELTTNRKDLKVLKFEDGSLRGSWELRHLEGKKWLLKAL